jgi:hypothetical protein
MGRSSLLIWLIGGEAQQDDSGFCRKPEAKRQFAEILVECQNQAILSLCPRQNRLIIVARHVDSRPDYVVPVLPQCLDGDAWKVLVRQELHALLRREVHTLGFQDFARIVQTSRDILMRQARVIVQKLMLGPAIGKSLNDKLDG